jgi:hypothetical protein
MITTAGVVAGAAAVTLPGAAGRAAAADVTGPLVVLRAPVRLFDSRVEPPSLGGGKLATGSSVAVTVVADVPNGGFVTAAFLNCTITETEGSGFLVLRPSDLSGEVPLPNTSNINWSAPGQTLANLVLTAVGGENAVEVHAGGVAGRTHVVIDLQGYIPFVA